MVAMHIDNMRFLSYSMIFLEYITMNVGHLARYADLIAVEVAVLLSAFAVFADVV